MHTDLVTQMRKMSVTPTAHDQSTSQKESLTNNRTEKQPVSDHLIQDYNLNAPEGMDTQDSL